MCSSLGSFAEKPVNDVENPLDSDALLARALTEYVRPRSIGQAIWTFPQNLAIAFMRMYRRFISPLYGDVCRYFPTCSAYSLEAFTTHGAVGGSWLTMRRLLRCHPWSTGGIDPVPPGKRAFEPDRLPKILLLNHPPTADYTTPHQHPGRGER